MIVNIVKAEDQKELFFQIQSIFSLAENIPYKGASGIYAIFKDGLCLYVGQSKNLPSRIATHLSGRYSAADTVLVYTVNVSSSVDFYSSNKDSQTEILLENEKYLMQKLMPLENIIADYNGEVNEDMLFDYFKEACFDNPCLTLYNTELHLSAYQPDGYYISPFQDVLNVVQDGLHFNFADYMESIGVGELTLSGKGDTLLKIVKSGGVK